MKLGIFAEHMISPQRSGVGHYVAELVNMLATQLDNRSLVLLHIQKLTQEWESFHHLHPEIEFRRIPLPKPFLYASWYTTQHPSIDWWLPSDLDLMHLPTTPVYIGSKRPKVVTIHDLASMRHPDHYPTRARLMKTAALKGYVKQPETHFVADTEATKGDFVELFDIEPERVSVVYLGLDHNRFCHRIPNAKRLVSQKYKIDFPYILFAGALSPRKNGPRVVEAFAQFKAKQYPHKLVFIGDDPFKAGENSLGHQINDLNLVDEVVSLGYIDKFDLPALYTEAELLMYPSLYEGFGFPILESMACGTPVVTSNLSCMPEVAGEAAHLVDPYSVESIAEGMRQIVDLESYRAGLIKQGLARANCFHWDKTANQMAAIYKRSL